MAAQKPFVPALDAANADPDAGTAYSFPRDLKGYGRHPPDPQWPGGAKIAVSFVINYEEVVSFNMPGFAPALLTGIPGRGTHCLERRQPVRELPVGAK